MIGVCLSGARGRMGALLVTLINRAEDLELSAALEGPGHPDLGDRLGPDVRLTDDPSAAVGAGQVVLDFSPPAAVCDHLRLAVKERKPFVTGTTGFSPEQDDFVRAAAGSIPLVCASNMSRGIHLLTRLVEMTAGALPGHDAEIFEVHHRNKVDSPSGTALQLARVIESSRPASGRVYGRTEKRQAGEVGLASARGGDVVGEHRVLFLGPGEQIILTHRATSREHFCLGALAAVRFVIEVKPGLYGMDDVFGEE